MPFVILFLLNSQLDTSKIIMWSEVWRSGFQLLTLICHFHSSFMPKVRQQLPCGSVHSCDGALKVFRQL